MIANNYKSFFKMTFYNGNVKEENNHGQSKVKIKKTAMDPELRD